ncbi:MAG TPA: DUF2281 domain-containing protein [Candidatus Hydrogenedentes bacterium]|nr:DUF2281 domain-containing protein [Candidatus Hydrogenedentota bacterium]
MSPVEQIQEQLLRLPPDKQTEVLDFISFLQQQLRSAEQHPKKTSLRQHSAFGSWSGRHIDALNYQYSLRTEWDDRS